MREPLALVAWLMEAEQREAIIGDLIEVRATRSRVRFWRDVLGVVLRAPKTRDLARVTGIAGLVILLALEPRAQDRRIVRATDPAGSFTLAFEGHRVVAATLDGAPVSSDRILQAAGRLVIRGGAGDHDLDIELHPDGSIHWQGRTPRPSPSP